MSLKECKACGGAVSGYSKTCPHCGEEQPYQVNWKVIWHILIALCAIVFVRWLFVDIPKPATKTIKTEKVDRYGVKSGSIIYTHNKQFWEKEYGGSLPSNFKINLWENSVYWNKGRGTVTGYTLPSNSLTVLTVNKNDYLVLDKLTGSTGWISKIQIKR